MAPQPPIDRSGVHADGISSLRTPESDSLPRQSPVDLGGATPASDRDFSIDYNMSVMYGDDAPTTLDFTVASASSITADGARYELNGFHFHAPSEHVIDGESVAAEVHFTHADQAGNLAVVAVLIEESDTSKGPRRLEQAMPMKLLLPGSLTHFAYEGSLTTPPFTEGVRWFVLTERVLLRPEWIEAFRDRYGANNRTLQPLNGRTITLG